MYFILKNKPFGVSSFDVIKQVRRQVGWKEKVGHTGTLDPFASGLLVVAVGEATKFIPYINGYKEYEFRVLFGVKTNSGDLEGEVIEQNDAMPDLSRLEQVLNKFLGSIVQIPSKFSAIKINGKRAYELARAGEEFKMPERVVHVFKLEKIDDPAASEKEIALRVRCSGGLYVRTLAEDIAAEFGCIGVVSYLHRTAVAPFDIAQAEQEEPISLNILSSMYGNIRFDAQDVEKLRHGNRCVRGPHAPPQRGARSTYSTETHRNLVVNADSSSQLYVALDENNDFQGIVKQVGSVILPVRMLRSSK